VVLRSRPGGEERSRSGVPPTAEPERSDPRGGAVDAELEDDGLFYAYNMRGDFRGHVVFVPFAELFR
jgi:hypothetical protein